MSSGWLRAPGPATRGPSRHANDDSALLALVRLLLDEGTVHGFELKSVRTL